MSYGFFPDLLVISTCLTVKVRMEKVFASFISSAMLFAVTVERKEKNEILVHSECTSRSDDRLVREILFEIYMVVIFPTVVVSTCAHP